MDEQTSQLLELIVQPVFFAQNGKIMWRNSAAAALIEDGTEITALLERDMLDLWTREDVMRFPLTLSGIDYIVSARTLQQGVLFVAEQHSHTDCDPSNRMGAAAAQLRKPLHSLFSAAQVLFEMCAGKPETEKAAAELNQTMYQLLRFCGQLYDGGRALRHEMTACRRTTDAKAFFDALAEEIAPLLTAAGLEFQYHGLSAPCRVGLDAVLVERAVYNLIANSLAFTPRGGTVTLTVERLHRIIAVKVGDTGEGLSPKVISHLFEPEGELTVGDPRWGLGMGLVLVREIARLHGGTLMLSGNGAEAGTTAVFSLSLNPAPSGLHSPEPQYDYTAGYHHGLVELSELLPADMYDPEHIL